MRGWQTERGTAAIEFAIASPFLLVLLAGITELGFAVYQQIQVENAAQAGALYAIQNGFDAAGISAAVTNAGGAGNAVTASPAPSQFCGCPSAAGIATAACGSTCTGGNNAGTYVQVNAAAAHQAIISWPGVTAPASLSAQSIVRVN